jgi:hypothetical protein
LIAERLLRSAAFTSVGSLRYPAVMMGTEIVLPLISLRRKLRSGVGRLQHFMTAGRSNGLGHRRQLHVAWLVSVLFALGTCASVPTIPITHMAIVGNFAGRIERAKRRMRRFTDIWRFPRQTAAGAER